ncbi:MAG TPA: hypothetical protein VE944_07650 [Nostoc sp.]|uniref:hypothetical protein n=1 Tax=Nostoc sp. TaxID=1180 RepID=UPI002D261CB3|nr:hypothetical protein [Nostoc sp.]HYX14228.1 hypothetical protein [Nostoc sp.]
MTSEFTTQEQFNQNGHYPSTQADLKPQPKSSTSLSEDWSSLTKELIDTLPRVWTRGLLYWLIIFAAIVLP